MLRRVLITGGAGFIGSEFARAMVKMGSSPVVLDKLTYAGDLARLSGIKGRYKFFKQDICNKNAVEAIFKKEKPQAVVHFAAESHVDRSILGSDEFVRTNIFGTQVLLDSAKKFGVKKFLHVSTDEVYGDIEAGQFHETTPLNPSSPYSATKASADMLVKSYIRTFKIPALIVRPSNNYGQWQYPEKFIPVIIYKALTNQKIPVYAKGLNVREWLYVPDCAEAIIRILDEGRTGEIYNAGSGTEKKNIDVVKTILSIMNKPQSLIEFVEDRPGHDLRYRLNSRKLREGLGWKPQYSFEKGIHETINWYKTHIDWVATKAKYLHAYWKQVYR